MRTRIALVAVFTVASIIAVSSAVLIRPVSSQAASTAPNKASTPTSSIPSAPVAFDSPKSSGSHASAVNTLGALLSLGTGAVAAASTAAAPVAADSGTNPGAGSNPCTDSGPRRRGGSGPRSGGDTRPGAGRSGVGHQRHLGHGVCRMEPSGRL